MIGSLAVAATAAIALNACSPSGDSAFSANNAATSGASAATEPTVPVDTTPVEPILVAQPPVAPVGLLTQSASPAIVPVAAPEAPFAAVGNNGGDETARIQQRLLDLGFWHAGVDGSYGLTTEQAVLAFQKYHGLERSGRVDDATAAALTNMTERGHALADAGTLVEVDKDRQLLFIVHGGQTVWIFNTSTGSGKVYDVANQNDATVREQGDSQTPNGLHAVTRQRPEGWWEGDLGKIYRPKYFVGGVAVHGSNSVPAYPASHGCVRLTTPAMDFVWDANLIPLDTPVWVHGSNAPVS